MYLLFGVANTWISFCPEVAITIRSMLSVRESNTIQYNTDICIYAFLLCVIILCKMWTKRDEPCKYVVKKVLQRGKRHNYVDFSSGCGIRMLQAAVRPVLLSFLLESRRIQFLPCRVNPLTSFILFRNHNRQYGSTFPPCPAIHSSLLRHW
jgi:hypothetical protein